MPEFVFDSGKIFSNFYVAFPRYKFGGFSRLFFDYFGFSLILKGFNVGQEINVFSHTCNTRRLLFFCVPDFNKTGPLHWLRIFCVVDDMTKPLCPVSAPSTTKCTCGVKKAGTKIVGGTPTTVRLANFHQVSTGKRIVSRDFRPFLNKTKNSTEEHYEQAKTFLRR